MERPLELEPIEGLFDRIDKEPAGTIIKVIGVGGAGGNAVDHMIREGVQGVEFICANTDAQALKRNQAPHRIQLSLRAARTPETPITSSCRRPL